MKALAILNRFPNPLVYSHLVTFRGDAVSIADFGCGDAKIAQSVTNPVYSFDLVKTNEHVIVANSKKVRALARSGS